MLPLHGRGSRGRLARYDIDIPGRRTDGQGCRGRMGEDRIGAGCSSSRRRLPKTLKASVAPTTPDVVTSVATSPSGIVGRPRSAGRTGGQGRER